MGLFAKRSSNGYTALAEMQRIKMFGGTALLSQSQIVMMIINLQDAKRNLSSERYYRVEKMYSFYRKKKKCMALDMNGYYRECLSIISSFEIIAPYLLFDGEMSAQIEMRDQLRINALHTKGIRFPQSLQMMEEHRDEINCMDFDSIQIPEGKTAFQMVLPQVGLFVKFLQRIKQQVTPRIFITAFAICEYLRIYTGPVNENLATAYIAYLLEFLAKHDYPDREIDELMSYRQTIVYRLIHNAKPFATDAKIIETAKSIFIEEMPALKGYGHDLTQWIIEAMRVLRVRW